MISIRQNTFETNSSSCHCFTIMMDSDLQRLTNKEALVYNFHRDVEEHGATSSAISHDDVVSPEAIVSLCENAIMSTVNVSDYYKAINDFVREYWSEDFVKWLWLDNDNNKLDNALNDLNKRIKEQYSFTKDEIISEFKSIYSISIDSFDTLFGKNWDNYLESVDSYWTPRNDKISMLSVVVNC